eukprot:scaffold33741_cov63-Phaeocystis_antarctica.AAC.5
MCTSSGGSICNSAHESSGSSSAAGRKEMATYTPPAARTPCTVHSSAATVSSVSAQSSVPLSRSRSAVLSGRSAARSPSTRSHSRQVKPGTAPWRECMCAMQPTSRSTARTCAYPEAARCTGTSEVPQPRSTARAPGDSPSTAGGARWAASSSQPTIHSNVPCFSVV